MVLSRMLAQPPEGCLRLVLLVKPRAPVRQLKSTKLLKASAQKQNIVRSTVFCGSDRVVRPARTKLVGRQTLLFEGRARKVTLERRVRREVTNGQAMQPTYGNRHSMFVELPGTSEEAFNEDHIVYLFRFSTEILCNDRQIKRRKKKFPDMYACCIHKRYPGNSLKWPEPPP